MNRDEMERAEIKALAELLLARCADPRPLAQDDFILSAVALDRERHITALAGDTVTVAYAIAVILHTTAIAMGEDPEGPRVLYRMVGNILADPRLPTILGDPVAGVSGFPRGKTS